MRIKCKTDKINIRYIILILVAILYLQDKKLINRSVLENIELKS